MFIRVNIFLLESIADFRIFIYYRTVVEVKSFIEIYLIFLFGFRKQICLLGMLLNKILNMRVAYVIYISAIILNRITVCAQVCLIKIHYLKMGFGYWPFYCEM